MKISDMYKIFKIIIPIFALNAKHILQMKLYDLDTQTGICIHSLVIQKYIYVDKCKYLYVKKVSKMKIFYKSSKYIINYAKIVFACIKLSVLLNGSLQILSLKLP